MRWSSPYNLGGNLVSKIWLMRLLKDFINHIKIKYDELGLRKNKIINF